MLLNEINPTDALKGILEERVTEKVYAGDKPTDKLPNEYLELFQNGGLKTNFSKMGIVEGYVMISISVKLLSTGGRNTKKENLILKKFDDLFENNKIIEKDGYVFQLEPRNMVYDGGGIYEGYTTKLINLKYNYYGNR